MFYNGKDIFQNDIRSVTYGWVYRVLKEDEAELHDKYASDRVRMGQCVTAKHPKFPSTVIGLPVILYWDPRHTQDGCSGNDWSCSAAEQLKWEKAAVSLNRAGVPQWYVDHVLDSAKRAKQYITHDNHTIEDTTICFNPQDLHYASPTTYSVPPRLQDCNSQRRIQKQVTNSSTVKAMPKSQPSPSGPQSVSAPQPVARRQSSTALKSAIRPQTRPRPQSAGGPQSANRQSGLRPQPIFQRLSTPTSPGPNVKMVKKRKLSCSGDGGQLLRRPVNKKPPPGPSNLRHGTPA
jgi:hypothetical protein